MNFPKYTVTNILELRERKKQTYTINTEWLYECIDLTYSPNSLHEYSWTKVDITLLLITTMDTISHRVLQHCSTGSMTITPLSYSILHDLRCLGCSIALALSHVKDTVIAYLVPLLIFSTKCGFSEPEVKNDSLPVKTINQTFNFNLKESINSYFLMTMYKWCLTLCMVWVWSRYF